MSTAGGSGVGVGVGRTSVAGTSFVGSTGGRSVGVPAGDCEDGVASVGGAMTRGVEVGVVTGSCGASVGGTTTRGVRVRVGRGEGGISVGGTTTRTMGVSVGVVAPHACTVNAAGLDSEISAFL